MSEKHSTIELIAWLIPYFGKRHHDMHMDAIIAKLRVADKLCEAMKEIVGRGVKGIVTDKDNDRCWLISMDKGAWTNAKKAIADYKEGK